MGVSSYIERAGVLPRGRIDRLPVGVSFIGGRLKLVLDSAPMFHCRHPSRFPVSLFHYSPQKPPDQVFKPWQHSHRVGTGQHHNSTPPLWVMIMHLSCVKTRVPLVLHLTPCQGGLPCLRILCNVSSKAQWVSNHVTLH